MYELVVISAEDFNIYHTTLLPKISFAYNFPVMLLNTIILIQLVQDFNLRLKVL